jgi:hypothetical protein
VAGASIRLQLWGDVRDANCKLSRKQNVTSKHGTVRASCEAEEEVAEATKGNVKRATTDLAGPLWATTRGPTVLVVFVASLTRFLCKSAMLPCAAEPQRRRGNSFESRLAEDAAGRHRLLWSESGQVEREVICKDVDHGPRGA